jgi:LCP family protein required for cell wall assembly
MEQRVPSPRRARVRRYGRGSRNAATQIRPQRRLAIEPPVPTEYTSELDPAAIDTAPSSDDAAPPADHELWAAKRDAPTDAPEPAIEPDEAVLLSVPAQLDDDQVAAAFDRPADDVDDAEADLQAEDQATYDVGAESNLADVSEMEASAAEDANDLAAEADITDDEDPSEPAAIALTAGDEDAAASGEDGDEWTVDLYPPEGEPVAPISVAADDAPGDAGYEEYVREIEAAAARQRAGQQGETGAAAPLRPRRGVRPATSLQPQARLRDGRRRPPNGAQRRKRKDMRPWYKRPKTWIIALAMLPVIAGIVISLYLANILRLSYNAYQEIHEDPVTDRVRYRVNPAGTPEPIPTEEAEFVLPNWDEKDPINILLLGIDSRPEDDEESPPRSDTTIIVHIDPETKQAAMLSIPRDLEVHIPEFGLDKLNAAYPLGEANADTIEGGGTTLVAQTIEANFNIPIHYYATVNFEGFVEIIDTVGGVIVDVEAPLTDNQYPNESLGYTRVHFHTGLQRFDGRQALRYVRTRHGDNDIRRGDRQAQVLTALQSQALDLNLITRAEELLNGLADTFRTDLDHSHMLALANLGRQIDMGSIQKVNLWDAGVLSEYTADDGTFYFVADWGAVAGLLQQPFGLATLAENAPATPQNSGDAGGGTPTEPQLDVQVIVENGTDIPQLAGNAAQMLFDAGFGAVWPSDAPELIATTVIYDATDDAVTARFVAEVLGLPNAEIVPAPDGDGITVVLGTDVPATLVPTPEPTQEE